jgi:hypothetical protein
MMKSTRSVPLAMFLLVLAAVAAAPAAAQETILQNDGHVNGQPAVFVAGFDVGEMAASRLVPAGIGPWRLRRVRFLFGGAASTQTITLHVYDDTAGNVIPGAELFTGDFLLTASDIALQEIDLTANEIKVTGPFRVAIEFQHTDLPSVARDSDDTVQPDRNFYLVDGVWYDSDFIVAGDWIIRAGVTDIGGSYFTIPSCRVVDTRGGAPLGSQVSRTLAIAGNCGIPATATSVSVNVAVTQPTAGGNVRLFAGGQVPIASTINYGAGLTRSSNAIVKLSHLGTINAFVGQSAGTTVHLILDVNGYFE